MTVLLAGDTTTGNGACVISPYSSPYGYNGVNNDNCLSDLLVTGRIADAQTDINGNINSQGQANLNATNTGALNNLNATHTASTMTQKSIYDAENAVSDRVTQHGLSNLRATDEVGNRLQATVANAKDRLEGSIDSAKDSLNNRFDWLGNNALQDFRALYEGQNTLSREILGTRYENSIKILESKYDLQKQLGEIVLEQTKSEARTREELLKGFASTQLDACKNTNEIQKQASDNFSKLQAQIAECCCENKLLTQTQSSETRELFLRQELTEERRCNDRNRNDNLEITITNIVNSSLSNLFNRMNLKI